MRNPKLRSDTGEWLPAERDAKPPASNAGRVRRRLETPFLFATFSLGAAKKKLIL